MHSVFVLVTLTNSLLVATLGVSDLILLLLSISDSPGLLGCGLVLIRLSIPSLRVCFIVLYPRVAEILLSFADSLTGFLYFLVDPATLFLRPIGLIHIIELTLLDRSGVCGLGMCRELLEALVEGRVLHSLGQIVCESLSCCNRVIPGGSEAFESCIGDVDTRLFDSILTGINTQGETFADEQTNLPEHTRR